MPDERGGASIDPDAAGSTVVLYDSRPSLAVQAASVVFGAKAAAAVVGGLWWGVRTATAAYETTLETAEAGASIVSAATELTGGAANAWAPPALVVVGVATWAFTRRAVRRVVLRLERLVDDDGQTERIRITHMPSLPWLAPPAVEAPREACEAADGDSLTPNFYSEPGGRWYLLPMPGWRSDDKEYLKIFLFWRFFRDEPAPPPDDTLVQIEGFGPYRPMQFADPSHPVARRVGWPAAREDLAETPFRGEGAPARDLRHTAAWLSLSRPGHSGLLHPRAARPPRPWALPDARLSPPA